MFGDSKLAMKRYDRRCMGVNNEKIWQIVQQPHTFLRSSSYCNEKIWQKTEHKNAMKTYDRAILVQQSRSSLFTTARINGIAMNQQRWVRRVNATATRIVRNHSGKDKIKQRRQLYTTRFSGCCVPTNTKRSWKSNQSIAISIPSAMILMNMWMFLLFLAW